MKKELHRAHSRGSADFGWLQSRQTFSFGQYYDPERMHFGVLRVLNDDVVEGGKGFGTHPHDNMEIISIPLSGALEHQDNMGNTITIKQGDVQVMSAGTGIAHSEYNKNEDKKVKFLQIWVIPKIRDVKPRYELKSYDLIKRNNTLIQIVSPDKTDDGVWIHQDAWFSIGKFEAGHSFSYKCKKPKNGLYIFNIEGAFEVAGEYLSDKDGIAISESAEVEMKPTGADNLVLVMEIPMELPA